MKETIGFVAHDVFPLQFTKAEPESPAEQLEDENWKDYYKYEFEENGRERNAKRAREREVSSGGIKQKYLGKKNPFKKK